MIPISTQCNATQHDITPLPSPMPSVTEAATQRILHRRHTHKHKRTHLLYLLHLSTGNHSPSQSLDVLGSLSLQHSTSLLCSQLRLHLSIPLLRVAGNSSLALLFCIRLTLGILLPLACLLTPALRFLASEPAPQTTKHTEQGKAVPTVQKAIWWQGFAQVSPPFSLAQLLPLHIQSAGCLSNEKLSSACHLGTTYFCLAAPWMRWAALVWCSMTLARAALRRSSAPRIDSLRNNHRDPQACSRNVQAPDTKIK